MSDHVRHPAGWLSVRQRLIVGGETAPARAEMVYCPFSEESIGISACFTCGFCDGVTNDAQGNAALLLCTRDMAEAGPISAEVPPFSLHRPVADLLSSETTCARKDTTLNALAALFEEQKLSALAIVDEHGIPVGVVTQGDLLRTRLEAFERGILVTTAPGGKGVSEGLGPGFHLDGEGTAEDVMSPATLTLPETAPIAQAAALMAWEGVRHLVITRPSGDVTGVLSALDILRWVAKLDGYVVPEGKEAPGAFRRRA